MHLILQLVAAVVGIASLVCWVVVLIDAFKDTWWKGLLALLCFFYWLYYAIVDFQHDNKWLIVLLAIFGGGISAGLGTVR